MVFRGSWNISQESFLENSEVVSNLRLRASYGTTGNQDGIGNFQSYGLYSTNSYGGTQGLAVSQLANPDLKWELSSQANVGFDFGFLKNRISGTLDLYNNITSDLFVSYQLSRTTGFTQILSNEGEMRNRGIEFSINVDVLTIGNFNWNVGGNIAYNDNEILDLGQVNEFEQGTSIIRVGLPLGSHYIVEWAGVNPSNGEPLYRDLEGNVTNVFDASNSKAIFGTSTPPTTGGFTTEWSYKGLSLSAFFTFAQGYSRFNNQTFFQENPNFAQFNLSSIMNTMWKEPGDITEVQSFRYQRQFSSKDIEDASYLRLRNVRLNYNLPSSLLNRTGFLKQASIFAQGQNLFTWTEFTGFDPEDDNNIAQYEYPASKVYTVGLNVKF
ncbi:TonB-dependent receptor domain-containing protein [Mangrovivirga cuniculi]|uniref:TonB-dependent receptor domain-containing protein n=1 Tax=Mangrovivirga cuniculi TaxID=2715131 RepID=UPI001586C4D9|nr:TonB-dependent receptor [Mangrovivirga cuniculi]